ncbi:hypothetical protein BJV78DRAFT_1152768 [Lactifluus subvellereus]|nr:hypothetical protein BJV78DRAFT_1152768 [Lactifluus subvellereus]
MNCAGAARNRGCCALGCAVLVGPDEGTEGVLREVMMLLILDVPDSLRRDQSAFLHRPASAPQPREGGAEEARTTHARQEKDQSHSLQPGLCAAKCAYSRAHGGTAPWDCTPDMNRDDGEGKAKEVEKRR